MVKLCLIISRRIPQAGSTGTLASLMVPLPPSAIHGIQDVHDLLASDRL